jgi:hypothetical protein
MKKYKKLEELKVKFNVCHLRLGGGGGAPPQSPSFPQKKKKKLKLIVKNEFNYLINILT